MLKLEIVCIFFSGHKLSVYEYACECFLCAYILIQAIAESWCWYTLFVMGIFRVKLNCLLFIGH